MSICSTKKEASTKNQCWLLLGQPGSPASAGDALLLERILRSVQSGMSGRSWRPRAGGSCSKGPLLLPCVVVSCWSGMGSSGPALSTADAAAAAAACPASAWPPNLGHLALQQFVVSISLVQHKSQ